MLKLLQQAHPFHESLRAYHRDIFLISVGVGLVLYFLRPFDIKQLTRKHGDIVIPCFVFIQWIPMAISSFWVRWKREEWSKNWTLGKELVWSSYQLLTVAIALWLGVNTFSFLSGSDRPASLMDFMGRTVFAGLFPLLVSQLVRHQYFLSKNLKEAKTLSQKIEANTNMRHPHLTSVSKNGFIAFEPKVSSYDLQKLGLQLDTKDLYYIESDGNYILLNTIQEGESYQFKIRMSLKQFQEEYNSNAIFYRCHRAYIVNTEKIKQVKGNASGLRLFLHPQLSEVPVARKNVQEFKSRVMNF